MNIQSLGQQSSDIINVLDTLINDNINSIWTTIVAEIVEYNTQERTVKVQPLIKEIDVTFENKVETIKLPVLEDVPVVYLTGGEFEITTPIKAGDECLVLFSRQCIDNWWVGGGVQPPFEYRFFDISDGFALVGVFSKKIISDKKFIEPSTENMEIRKKDDNIKISLSEKDVSIITQTGDNKKSKINDLIIDNEGNFTYTIYNNDDINNKLTINKNGLLLEINKNKTIEITQDTITVTDGKSVIELSSDGIKLEHSPASIEIKKDSVSINGSTLKILI